MLFRRNGRSVKFCLVGLDAEERKEIASLITRNGGKIRGPMSTRNNRVYGDAFHHVNYIHEYLRQGELLDLHPFRTLSLRSPARKNRGSFFADNYVGRIYEEHNYSGVFIKRERDNNKLLNLTLQAPLIVLGPSLDDLSQVSSRYLRQMYSLMIETDGKNETKDSSLDKHEKETEKPRPWSPIVITRRWVRETAIKAVSQTDDEKLAMRNRTIFPKIVDKQSIDEPDDPPLIQRLDDVPLAERLHRTRKSNIEESEDSDDFLNISSTLRKRRILSSSSGGSADSDVTVLLKDSGQTKRSNTDKGSLDVETEEKINEHSYDSAETVLWADFSRKKKGIKSKDRRKPRGIHSDSTDTETFSRQTSSEREKKSRRSRESQAITRMRSSTRESLSSSSNDETEYEADTELEDDRSGGIATSEEPPGTSRSIEVDGDDDSRDDGTSLDMEKKKPQKSRNGRDPCPGDSSDGTKGSTGSNNDVIWISDDDSSDSDSSSAAGTASVPKARIAVRVEDPKKRSQDRIEKPAMNVQRNIQLHKVTRNFGLWEQKMMVKYLIDNDAVSMSKGYAIWKKMIEDGLLTHRTYQSLHNNFRKSILPNIHRFGIGGFDLEDFQKLKT